MMSTSYTGKRILAPMVRVGTLPMRLLSLDYGADLVYCEEIIDRKILNTTRTENGILGTTDFTLSDGTVVFRTCPQEKERLVFQMGTSDAKRALAAAKMVENDVSAIDINMGCPKEFSVKGGMGCALLTQPEKIRQILTTLVEGLSIPVTCKIRVFPEVEETVKLAKLIESTGVAALAVHGRTRDERPRHTNRNETIEAIAEALSIPIIANGGSKEIQQFSDIEEFRLAAGASSVMIARQAEWNCSIFRPEGKLPLYDVIRAYLQYALRYDNNDINTKYCLLQMMHETMEAPEGQATLTAKTNEEFSEIWGMQAEYHQAVQDRKQKMEQQAQNGDGDSNGDLSFKRRKTQDGLPLIQLPVRYDKKCYRPAKSPKQSLHEWCYQCRYKSPVYATDEIPGDRSFTSRVLVDGKWYTTPFSEKRKQYAEQSAAMCCLLTHGIEDGRVKEPPNESPELRHKWRQLALHQIAANNETGASGDGGPADCDHSHEEGIASAAIDSENSTTVHGKGDDMSMSQTATVGSVVDMPDNDGEGKNVSASCENSVTSEAKEEQTSSSL